MSSFLTKKNGIYEKEIESLDICKWRISGVCCNETSKYLGEYPYPYCKCESKEQCNYFEKEDGNKNE